MNTAKITSLLASAILFTFVLSTQAQDGYWKYLRMEKLERHAESDAPNGVHWSGKAGNLLFTVKAKDAISIEKAPYREDQEVSATYTWDRPPSILIAGEKASFQLSCQVNVNSHPDQGRGLGGQATAWMGWLPSSGGAMNFRDKEHPEKYILAFDTYSGDPVDSVKRINKQAAALDGLLEIPVAHPSEREENGRKIAPVCIAINVGSADAHVFQYIYEWYEGSPPNEPSDPSDTTKPVDIAGTWKHGDNDETWTFVPVGDGSYKATESGFGNASGTAVVSGRTISIDYKTADGKVTGKYIITIADSGKSGLGKWTDSLGNRGERIFDKSSTGSNETKSDDITSTGAEDTPGTENAPGSDNVPGTTSKPPMVPESGMVLQIESKSVREGDSTTVAVWLHRATGLANMNFELTYQSDIAGASTVDKGRFLPSKTAMESNARDAGIIRIGFAGKTDLSGTGPIAHIPFTAVGKAGTKTPLTLKVTTASSAENTEPAIQLVNGFIEIVSAVKPGDSNNNGVLDSGDALAALRMSVKLIPEDKVADIDKDGQVTSTDARLILEQVVQQSGANQ